MRLPQFGNAYVSGMANRGTSSFPRARSLAGALLAALALAGAVQAARPVSASAQKTVLQEYCYELAGSIFRFNEAGEMDMAKIFEREFLSQCGPEAPWGEPWGEPWNEPPEEEPPIWG
jgi:hypothetical protein